MKPNHRLSWPDLPAPIRTAIERIAGDHVVGAMTCSGGFSPGLASSLRLAGGGRVFAKALNTARSSVGARYHRQEASCMGKLHDVDGTPKLLGTFDDGDWIALVFADIDGRTVSVDWTNSEVAPVVEALTGLHRALTPAPTGMTDIRVLWRDDMASWHRFNGGEHLDALLSRLPWAYPMLPRLVELEADWERVASGRSLLHGDLRSDNIMIGTGGQIHFVDWAHACVGNPAFDLIYLLSDLRIARFPAESIVKTHPATATMETHDVDVLLATLAGMYLLNAFRPPPRYLDALRPFQFRHGWALLDWIRYRWASAL